MKNSKKGISLIVLIITIIVIIILATAILVSVLTNNPISEANKARYESDRDNMQAVFTNTVGKIMAENQGVVNVTAGQINTVTKDVKEATGEVAYTVDNATVAENASGKIVFDKGTNDATTYYTGKKLPIYAAGETKWYVDSEGVLTLEVAGVKYGNGKAYTSLGNFEHKNVNGTIEAHDTESGICSKCGENVLAPGLYDENDVMIASWDELVNDYGLDVEIDQSYSTYQTAGTSGYCVLSNEQLSSGVSIIVDGNITKIGKLAFSNCENLISITLPNTIISIGTQAFGGCKALASIIIPNGVTKINSSLFSGCTNLATVTISESVTSIGSFSFSSCNAMTDIYIPNNVTRIDSTAFAHCDNLVIHYDGPATGYPWKNEWTDPS